MEDIKVEEKEDRELKAKEDKLDYKQLEEIAHKATKRSAELYQKLQESNMFNMFKRLDYLFKVIENVNTFKDLTESSMFVRKCIREVEEILTLPEENNTQGNSDTK